MKKWPRVQHALSVFLVLSLLVGIPAIGIGAVIGQINFQGYLTDNLGSPLNGNYIMTFGIYSVATGGTALWSETQTVPVADGVYSLILGQAGNEIDPADMDGERYLGVSVASDPEMSPRQPLTATPFALKAAIAEGVADNAITSGQIATGAVGSLEIADGEVAAADLAEDYVNTSGDTITGGLTIGGALNLPNGTITSGTSSLLHFTNDYSLFLGENAGNTTMTGDFNTVVGYEALSSNTTGFSNSAYGYAALLFNTEGSRNTAGGYRAIRNNSIGSDNTAIGSWALQSNTTANKNTAVGSYALFAQDFSNKGVAWDANNTAVGYDALRENTPEMSTYDGIIGTNNTALGASALADNTTGRNNTASGAGALSSNTTGWDCTAIGSVALSSNTTGANNTASGAHSLKFNTTGNFNTANGLAALRENTTGDSNTASGESSLMNNTTGDGNTAYGLNALYHNITGSDNTAIGVSADVALDNLTNATAIGHDAEVDGSNRVRIGNTSVSQIGGQVAWSNLSDKRDKEEIGDSPFGLDFIRNLKPVVFKIKNGNGRWDLGFIAQDIEELVGSEYNLLGIGGTGERKLSLRYTDFIAPMVSAIQEQQAIIESQQSHIESLEMRLAAIEARLGK